MPASLIRDTPVIEWAAGERVTLTLSPFTPRTGSVVADYSAFALALRRDPLWPRTGSSAAAAGSADPTADGWPVVVTATGSLVSGGPTFTFDVPALAGVRRYALDVWAVVGGGAVQLVRAVWVTVGPRVVPG